MRQKGCFFWSKLNFKLKLRNLINIIQKNCTEKQIELESEQIKNKTMWEKGLY